MALVVVYMAFVLEVVVVAEEEEVVEIWVWEASVVLPSSVVAV